MRTARLLSNIANGKDPIFEAPWEMILEAHARGSFLMPSLTDASKANAEEPATAHGLQIDYIRKKNFRKEDRIKGVLKERGPTRG